VLYRSLLIILLATSLIGCSTTSQAPKASSNLQIKVAQLERKLHERDQKINELVFQISELTEEVEGLEAYQMAEPIEPPKRSSPTVKKISTSSDPRGIIRVKATPKQVQVILRNAGYYEDAIDGKIGSKTKKAIKQFQADHDLKSDGIIGARTWKEMQHYIE